MHNAFRKLSERPQHALFVGGGYIGLEVAAAAAGRGLRVTLIEAGPRILGRVAGPPTADAIRAAHKRKGVDIREGVGLSAFVGTDQVKGAILSDGAHVAADCVIVGIGIDPNVTLAKSAGLATENGILVDPTCQTSQPGIWAAGDCAAFPMADQITRAGKRRQRHRDGRGRCRKHHGPVATLCTDGLVLVRSVRLEAADGRPQPGIRSDCDPSWRKPRCNIALVLRSERLLSVDIINEPKTYIIANA